jgi:PRC-barrel domain
MLQLISPLKGFSIEASDGRIGTVVDFLFDDRSWKVLWLVVDAGHWLQGRKVLIDPSAISLVGLDHERIEMKLTRAQVETGPEWLEHQPVSAQMQARLYDHYGWDPVWRGPHLEGILDGMASPMMGPPYLGFQMGAKPSFELDATQTGDPHLRSIFEVIGHHVHAVDGDIGHVENFMFDDDDWTLRYFVVDTSDWWFGNRVLIAMQAATAVEWSDRHVSLDVTREVVRTSPKWDPLAAFNELERTHLHNHYGWAGSLRERDVLDP